jgi:predicted mannosyl-3-phosphoglycerate phosphatase (HAD superfamily)
MAVMAKQKVLFHLRKRHHRSFAPADKATSDFMDSIPANEEVYVELKKLTKEDIRSAAQNRLLWTWYTDMSKTTVNEWAGRDKEDWHFEMKKRFLVPIFERDNESYALMLVALRKVYMQGMKAEAGALYKHIVAETSTTGATTVQFTEYLNEISRFCGHSGIWLRTDDRLLAMAMGMGE